MPARERGLARLRRPAAGRVVVTCEHASNALPGHTRRLGLSTAVLRSHAAWDPGARALARMLARRLHAPCFTGRYSRLLVDLNRSRGHRHLIAAERFGHPIPGNRDLTPGEREARIARYWQPYRDAVERAVQRRILRGGSCLHLSVHSFAPVLGGETRTADVGLLYDPQRHRERAFAHWMRRALTESGLATRMNYPYAGTSDGFTTYCRRRWPGSRYLGIELEVNQRRLRTGRALCHTGRVLSDAVAEAAERWIRRAVGRG